MNPARALNIVCGNPSLYHNSLPSPSILSSSPPFDVCECMALDNEVISPGEQQQLVPHQNLLEVTKNLMLRQQKRKEKNCFSFFLKA